MALAYWNRVRPAVYQTRTAKHYQWPGALPRTTMEQSQLRAQFHLEVRQGIAVAMQCPPASREIEYRCLSAYPLAHESSIAQVPTQGLHARKRARFACHHRYLSTQAQQLVDTITAEKTITSSYNYGAARIVACEPGLSLFTRWHLGNRFQCCIETESVGEMSCSLIMSRLDGAL